ncbi:hypothetical protein Patl1_08215 [Pistacia atlantica]|uniref:Uncharacterized protein n=1 Tax=Pistacia atlantica TaxID=434234 RepID=A0ACC1AFU5_9ROSI|nr:hypothetical protein Patl1_08215 [Pistacia atlantica]
MLSAIFKPLKVQFDKLLLQFPLAKPGCEDRCGGVEIPYPFGTTTGCFLNDDFLITCNNSFNPPQPFLRKSKIPVTNITIDGRLHVMSTAGRDCYEGGKRVSVNRTRQFSLSDFSISNTENKFTVIGCDSYAYIRGYLGNQTYRTGCMSLCENIDLCPKRNLRRYRMLPEKFPTVIDWTISGNGSCENASRTAPLSYACKENSECYDPDEGDSGYRCRCKTGYEGNPYLSNGCQDIDECNDSSLHNCEHICDNQEGSYTCQCRKGYHGDGRKDGDGCIPNQFSVVKVTLGVGISIVVLLLSSSWLYLVLKKRKLIKLKEKVRGEERPTMREVAMALDGLKVMPKHAWDNAELISEETKYLLCDTPDVNKYGDGSTSTATAGYDSIRDQIVAAAFDNGR